MVSPTTPDGISRWEFSDAASLVQMSTTMGDSIQAAFSKRERYSFTWANSSERTAQTGMVAGSMGYQIDTQADYIYTGSAWRIYNLMMQPFTPAFIQGITIGSGGTSNGFVTISAGWAFVYYSFTYGTGSSISGDCWVQAPALAPVDATLLALGSIKVGNSNYEDSSAGAGGRYEGTALCGSNVGGTPYPNGAFRWGTVENVTSDYTKFSPLDNLTPMTWASGDKMHMAINYPVDET